MGKLEKDINKLTNDLIDELNKSFGFRQDGFLRPVLKLLVWKPMVRFSDLATKFDYRVINEGFQRASAWLISNLFFPDAGLLESKIHLTSSIFSYHISPSAMKVECTP